MIVNPHSGRGRGAALVEGVLEGLRARGGDATVQFTESLEHASDLARHAVNRGSVAVAAGGDGLVSCVAAAVAEQRGIFGLVPMGRGNDFARSLGIRSREHAVEVLALGNKRRVDLGTIDGRYFTCIASAGIDTAVVEAANRLRKVPGNVVYPLATLRALAGFRPVVFSVTSDGREVELPGYSLAVANAPFYGGGMKMAPGAVMDDGELDLVVIGPLSKAGFLLKATKVFRGTHVEDRAVTVMRAKRFSITCAGSPRWCADGEIAATGRVTLATAPGALEVLAPG